MTQHESDTMSRLHRLHRPLPLSPKMLEETSLAMGRWVHRPLDWWHRQPEVREAESARPPVTLTIAGAVATVALNRPERRNALNLASWEALRATATRLADDDAVRVVVLTGHDGGPFSAGSDIAEFPQKRLGGAAARQYTEVSEAALDAWSKLPQPVVARIAGYCLGAALELALTADFRIASDDAAFGIPAVRLGIGISVADARRLIDVVGPSRAKALLLSGERVSAARALALGLIDDAVPLEELDQRVERQVRLLLANAPKTMAWIKQAVDFAARHPDGEPFGFDVLGTRVFDSHDTAEGVQAFLTHRAPEFTGQ